MIIVLHGENGLFTKRKLDEIVASYKAKHASGLSFFVFDADAYFTDIKSAWETVPLFEEKKLLVLKGILSDKKLAEEVVAYLRAQDAKEDKERVVVFFEAAALPKKSKDSTWLCEAPSIMQESKNLTGAQLETWIVREAHNQDAQIEKEAAAFLIQACGSDMWRIANEIAKLACYDARITLASTELLVQSRESAQIFDAVSALAQKNAAKAVRAFGVVLKEQDWPGVLGLIIFQFRAILKARMLLDEKTPSATLEKEMGMHPFALRKTLSYAKNYTRAQAESLFVALCAMDGDLKTGNALFEPVLERFTLRVAGLMAK